MLSMRIFALINYLKKSSYKGDKYNNNQEPIVEYIPETIDPSFNESLFMANQMLTNLTFPTNE